MSAERRAAQDRWRRGRYAPSRRALVIGAVLVAATLAAAWLVDDAAALGPVTLTTSPTLTLPGDADCGRWHLVAGRGQVRGAVVSLFTDGVAVARACDDAARALLLEGSSARGVGAFAVVSDADGLRFDAFVDASVTLSVRGDVRVAFTNDLATADEDRNLHATLR